MRALSLEKIFHSGLTGKGVKVAVVDSGINPWHSHVKRTAGGIKISLDESNQVSLDDGDIYDTIGHGTACAGVIRKYASEVELYSVKIFEKTLTTYTVVLIEAISWCIDNGIDIINLSLGTQNKKHLFHFREVCKDAYQKGIIIVAAAKNGEEESYPASFPEVIGVTSHPKCQENIIFYREASPIKFLASGFPRSLPGLPSEYNFRGESFSSAHLSGVITLLREKYPFCGVEEIKNLLSNIS